MTTAFNSTARAVSGNVQRIKNSSTILGITKTPSSNVSNYLSVEASTARGGAKNGYPVVGGTYLGRAKAVSSGAFAYVAASKYVMLGNAITLTIGGLSNTVLKSGSAEFSRRGGIPYKLTQRTSFITTISWTSSSISGPRYTITNQDRTISYSDTEATLGPATANRGNLVFLAGKTVPYSTTYKALTLW